MARPGSSGVEQRIENPRVGGSIPPPGTIQASSDVRGPPPTSIKTRLQGGASRAFVRQRPPKNVGRNFFVGILLASRRPGTSTAGEMPTLFDDANKMPLTDTRIRGLKPDSRPKRYSDGYGLYLEVTPGGSKLWKMAYRFESKQKTLSFGPYPEITLGRARERRLQARTSVFVESDPASDDAGRVLEAFKAVSMEANCLPGTDDAFDHAVLLRAMRGDEL